MFETGMRHTHSESFWVVSTTQDGHPHHKPDLQKADELFNMQVRFT